MTATTIKPIAAYLQWTANFEFSVLATEAEWKKLTEDYQEPGADLVAISVQDIIIRFIKETLSEQLGNELEGVELVLEEDTRSSSTVRAWDMTADPSLHSVRVEDCWLEEIV